MKIYTSPFLSRALSTAILACCFATASLNAQVPVISGSFAEAYVVNVEIPTYTITASNTPTSYGATSLPPGLLRVGATIVGTPSQAGVFNVTLFALNADGFDQRTLELTVSGAEIESSLSETATVGEPYTYQITANNGPTVFNEIGLVDFPGLSLDTATGLISGTPTEVRTSDIFIQAINGASVATALLVLDVSGVPPAEPTVTIDSPLNGADYTDGDPITLEITADDADGFLTQVKVFSGTIFLGIAQFIGVDQYSFQSNTGTAGLEVGTQNLTVQATDNVGNVVTSDSVVVDVLPKATGAAPDVSITSPTAGNSIKSGETLEITVDASDADTDGFITSVEVFNNAVSLGLANPTGAAGKYLLSYRTSAADLGNLNLQARAVDNQGNVGYSAVIDYSVVQGAVPTVSIDDPLNGEDFLINTQIPLAITANDGDDSIVSVEVFSNGTSVGFASSLGGDQYEFTLTATATAGLQRLTAVATDELSNSTTSSEVNVLLSNGASPVTVLNTVNGSAPAVAPLVDEVDLGSVVTLDISASDSDGNVTQVEVFNGATSIGLAALVGVDTYRFDYQASSPGLLNLQVRASDDLGNIGFSDLVPVSVITGAIPDVSITSPTAGNSIKSGETLEITVDASDADTDGFITSVEVFNNAVSLGLANPTGAVNEFLLSYRTSAADLGNLNLQARAVDNQGNVGYSDVIAYSVVQGVVPEVSITSPDNGDVFLINTPISLAITADEGDESIITVEVFSDGSSVGFASLVDAATGAYAFTLTETGEAGLQRLTAVATDELSNSTTSSEVNVLLSNGAAPVVGINEVNGVAVVDPQLTPVVVARGSVVTLAIAASDNDGNVTQVEVYNGAVPVGFATLVAPNTYRFDYQASSPGLVKFQMRASDDLGNIGFSDLVEVSVVTGAMPTVAITLPGGTSYTAGEVITIDVAAGDVDGFVKSVAIFNGETFIAFASKVSATEYRLNLSTSLTDVGLFQLNARATDDSDNVSITDYITVSVITGAVPTVVITSPADGTSYTAGDVIPIDVTAGDTDGIVTSVVIYDGATSALLGQAYPTGEAGKYQLNYLTGLSQAGLLNLEARAIDDSGNVSISSSISVRIVAGAVPLVEITSPVPGFGLLLGDLLELTITATDVDDGIALIEVFNLSTEPDDFLGVASATSVPGVYQLYLTPEEAGSYQLQARATDTVGNLNASLPVQVSVTSGEAPTVDITNPVDGGADVVRGSLLQINMTADDNDGVVTQVEVYSGNVLLGLAELSGTGSYRYFYSANQPGQLALNARATDDRGNVSVSDFVTVTVAEGDVPTVAILSPADEASYTAGEVITIDVTAGDTDGFVTSVVIYDGATQIGTAAKVSATEYRLNLSTSLTDVGLFQLNARATDDSGNVSISELATVTVVTGAVPTVAITLPDGNSYTAGDVITIDVTAADTDGQVTSVAIYDGADPIGTASKVSATGYRLNLSTSFADVGGLYLEARATDDSGNVSISDIVEVTVVELIFAVTFIDPTENPLVLRSTISPIEQACTIEIAAANAAAIQSVQWYFADVLVAESAIVADTLSYSETLNLAKSGELRVKVTDAVSGISVEATMSVIVSINIETPLNSDEAFVRDAYVRLTANTPTDTYVANAVAQMDGTVDGQVAYLQSLFDSSDMVETEQVLMVYRTMTGEWPDATELAAARAGLFGGTVATAAAPGSIETGVPQQTFEFFYNAGDAVTVSVTGAGDDPLSDPTLTINSPSGVLINFDDDSGLGLNPLVNFTATEAGTYSAIVAGFSALRGDFTISSSATNLGGSTSASLQALVISLIPEFEARFDLTFPISTVTPSTEATDLVNQLFKVKHGVNPSAQATVRLKESLTGSGSGSWPGYSGNLTAFTVAFALDNSRSSFNQAYSRVHYYQIPNQAFDDVPLALMIAMFLGEDPTDQALAAYAGMTQAQAFESIITDPRYYVQFPSSGVESFVSLKLADLGVFDQSLNGPADDADDDGVSNLMEIALGSDPSDPSDTIEPMATDMEGTEFVITFIRIKASEVPGDFIISLECSEDLTVWDAAADTASVTSTEGVIQDGVPEGYERVEIRIDMMVRDCGFFRLSVDLP